MKKDSLKFLEDLCNVHGPSGFEREATTLMKGYVDRWADSVYNDKIGSLVFEKNGEDEAPVILVPGHIDEIGFIVTGINDTGFLNFYGLGGWFNQALLGQKVLVLTNKGKVQGIIAAKPPHVMDREERNKVVTMDKMFIDIGAANSDEAKELGARIGDAAVPDSSFNLSKKARFKDGKKVDERTIAFGKAFDDRIGAFLAAELVRTLKEKKIKHPNRVVGAATVQEEVGLRGARTVANMVKPDVALVLDVDIAGDVPGIRPDQAPAKMGDGVAITVFDASMIPNQPLKELAIEICEQKKIPYQLAQVTGGGTDAGAIHISNVGCPSLVMGVATRHIHSHVGIIDMKDVESNLRLLVELVKVLDKETVEGLVKV
jgi:putative aminopeptidase FrvX